MIRDACVRVESGMSAECGVCVSEDDFSSRNKLHITKIYRLAHDGQCGDSFPRLKSVMLALTSPTWEPDFSRRGMWAAVSAS